VRDVTVKRNSKTKPDNHGWPKLSPDRCCGTGWRLSLHQHVCRCTQDCSWNPTTATPTRSRHASKHNIGASICQWAAWKSASQCNAASSLKAHPHLRAAARGLPQTAGVGCSAAIRAASSTPKRSVPASRP